MSNPRKIVAGALAIAAMGIGLYFAIPEPEDTTREARVRATIAAPELHEGEIPPEIRAFFADLGDEFQNRKGAGVAKYFDADRLATEIETCGNFDPAARGSFLEDASRGIETSIAELTESARWERTDVRHLRWYSEGRDAVVTTRHFYIDDEGEDASAKIRWWLAIRGGKWRIHDYEELRFGGRISLLIASKTRQRAIEGQAASVAEGLNRFAERFSRNRIGVRWGDYAEAEAFFAKPFPPELHPRQEALFYYYKGLVASGRGDRPGALEAFDRAGKLDPDIAAIHLLRATAHNALGQSDDAIASAKKYLAEVGPSAGAYFQIAEALAEQEDLPGAREAYRKALDEMPNSPDKLDAFRRTLGAADKREFGERFAALSRPEKHTDDLFYSALGEGDEEGAWQLALACRRLAPRDPQGLVREGQMLLRFGRADEALARFLEAVALPASKRSEAGGGILRSAVDFYAADRGEIAAYAAFAKVDPRRVFRALLDQLANGFLERNDGRDQRPLCERIEGLIAAHAKLEPGDPWLDFARGEASLEARDVDPAERAFAEAVRKLEDGPERLRALNRRVFALCEMGRGIDAYLKVDRTARTFEQVADYLMSGHRADELNRLVVSRWRTEAQSGESHYWNGQVAWLKKDYRKAAVEYRWSQDLERKKYAPIVHDQLVRSLLRSRQLRAAKKEIESAHFIEASLDNLYGRYVHFAILAAHEGDLKNLSDELAQLREQGYNDYAIHADEDLGPMLRDDPRFRTLLERYPVPPGFGERGPGRGE